MSIQPFQFPSLASFSASGSAKAKAQAWRAGEEPALRELLADPLLHLVMRRDRVSFAELHAVIADARAKLEGTRVARAELASVGRRRGLCCGLAA
jgi:hypothetical protein